MQYRYITQEVIDKGVLNVTSGAMDAEVQAYNDRVIQLHRKKKNVDLCFVNWCAIQFLLAGICAFYMTVENDVTPMITLRVLSMIPYAFLFIWFVLYRKNRQLSTVFLVSLLLPLVSLKLIALTAANSILAHFYTKLQNELISEPGYPDFTRLKATYHPENSDISS